MQRKSGTAYEVATLSAHPCPPIPALPPADCKLSETRTLAAQWAAPQVANQIFAEVARRHYQDGDIVWIQDYHLMLLPAILKERKPRMKVCWRAGLAGFRLFPGPGRGGKNRRGKACWLGVA
jgi:hypothetical protein